MVKKLKNKNKKNLKNFTKHLEPAEEELDWLAYSP